MKRPLTPKEKAFRYSFYTIVVIEILIGGYIGSLLFQASEPKQYLIKPTIGFAVPNAQYGYYDVATFEWISTRFFIPYVFVQGTQVHVNITAFVNNGNFNKTENRLFFSFQEAQIWDQKGCHIQIPPPSGIELQPVAGTKGYVWYGAGDICYLYQGDFAPIFTIDDGKKLTKLQEATGESFSLHVSPPETFTNYIINQTNLSLTGIVALLQGVSVFPLLFEIYPRGFPYRVEYGRSQ